jgi:O-antigen/teichoic acid export membrane protein
MLKNFITSVRAYLSKGGLGAQAVRGGVWLGAGTVAAQLLRLGRNIFLTRLLSPDSFGAMAIIISIGSMMDTFTEIGTRESIIQNPNGCKDEYLNSAFWLSAGRSVFSYTAIFLLAPQVAAFYRNPELADLGRIALLGVVFRGIMSPRAFVSLKVMDYKRWTLLQYGTSIAASVATVVLAIFVRSVWALAIGFAFEYVLLFLASYILFPFRPRIAIEKHSAQQLFEFSRGVFGLSFLNLIYVRADIFVLGRLVSPEQLGIYTLAVYLAQAPATFALSYQAQILMPVFSQLQTEHERTNSILARGASLLAFFLIPVLIFVALSGRTLLALLYGARYASGFWPFLIAAIIAFINIANAQLTTAFYAAGRPQLHRLCLCVMALLIILLIYPAAHYLGAAGAQLAALLAMIAGYGIQLRQARSLNGFRLGGSRTFRLRLAGALLVLAIAAIARDTMASPNTGLNLVIGVLAALLFLLANALMSYRHRRWHIAAI